MYSFNMCALLWIPRLETHDMHIVAERPMAIRMFMCMYRMIHGIWPVSTVLVEGAVANGIV